LHKIKVGHMKYVTAAQILQRRDARTDGTH